MSKETKPETLWETSGHIHNASRWSFLWTICRCSRAFSSSPFRLFTLENEIRDGEIGCFNERNYTTPYNSPPLSTHTTAPKAGGGTTDRERPEMWGRGQRVNYDNTRLVRTSLCTWILIGLRDYWSKWADRRFLHGGGDGCGGARGEGGGSRRRVRHSPGAASDSPQPINWRSTDTHIDHLFGITETVDAACHSPETEIRNVGVRWRAVCEQKTDFFFFLFLCEKIFKYFTITLCTRDLYRR